MNPPVQIDITKPTLALYRMAAVLAILALLDFAGAPICKAVTPAPDGGYPNGNTAEGTSALFSLTTGVNNTALGSQALYSDTSGSANTATGWNALRFNTASDNTATGTQALYKNTTGTGNTAVGRSALLLNTTTSHNTAIGFQALQNNLAGENTAVGHQTLVKNTTGFGNVAQGYQALFTNTTGIGNVANGYQSLFNNYSGHNNNAYGAGALFSNSSGTWNVAVGSDALNLNTTGCCNNALGFEALVGLSTGDANTAIGYLAGILLTTGSGNVYIGANVGGASNESDHTYIRNINTTTVSGGGTDTVTVDLNTGLLGHASSSRRYKEQITPMDNASQTLYRLKPVTFRYKKEIDHTQSMEYGLVAEEVAEVDPSLAIRDRNGQIESVRYAAVNAMLLNEFLKEHRKVEEQGKTIAELRSTIAQQQRGIDALVTQVKEQGMQIQRVSAELAASKPAPQLVDNR